jgi:hypothetical protein
MSVTTERARARHCALRNIRGVLVVCGIASHPHTLSLSHSLIHTSSSSQATPRQMRGVGGGSGRTGFNHLAHTPTQASTPHPFPPHTPPHHHPSCTFILTAAWKVNLKQSFHTHLNTDSDSTQPRFRFLSKVFKVQGMIGDSRFKVHSSTVPMVPIGRAFHFSYLCADSVSRCVPGWSRRAVLIRGRGVCVRLTPVLSRPIVVCAR